MAVITRLTPDSEGDMYGNAQTDMLFQVLLVRRKHLA